ncbi:MAG: PDZ domain-containing protein, partial [Longimicrobiales bacterium]
RRRRMFGMLVVEVAAGSAAALAGIRPGDVVRSLGGLPIAAPSDIAQLLHAASAAGRIAIGMVREGRPLELEAELHGGPPGARAA